MVAQAAHAHASCADPANQQRQAEQIHETARVHILNGERGAPCSTSRSCARSRPGSTYTREPNQHADVCRAAGHFIAVNYQRLQDSAQCGLAPSTLPSCKRHTGCFDLAQSGLSALHYRILCLYTDIGTVTHCSSISKIVSRALGSMQMTVPLDSARKRTKTIDNLSR
jgi:hypothetical protein